MKLRELKNKSAPNNIMEGVLGCEVLGSEEKVSERTYPECKFDYDAWRKGQGPLPHPDRRVSKPDPSRWNDIGLDRRKESQ